MTKAEAIKWFKDIQNGQGVDRSDFPDDMKGSIAKRFWDDSTFTYGIEYGVLIALRKMFGITTGDLRPVEISICLDVPETCYFHPKRGAAMWRKTAVIGEPERVPLCYECCADNLVLGYSTYPLNERREYQPLDEV